MATLNKIEVIEGIGVRTNDIIIDGYVWFVEKGEPFNIIKFELNEAPGYYFPAFLCIPKQTTKDEIEKLVKDYVNGISEEQVKNFKALLEFGEKYGWD